GCAHIAPAEVEADRGLAHVEKDRSARGAHPDVAPLYERVRQYLENHREQQGVDDQRAEEVGDLEHTGDFPSPSPSVATQGGGRRAQHEGYAQEEAGAEDCGERQQSIADQVPESRVPTTRYVPDPVEGPLQLAEGARGAEQKDREPDQR